jgi:hypothetical protein
MFFNRSWDWRFEDALPQREFQPEVLPTRCFQRAELYGFDVARQDTQSGLPVTALLTVAVSCSCTPGKAATIIHL